MSGMSRYAVLNEIRTLDPEADHQRIVFLTTCYEFPFDTTRALEFALFRTYCVPSISSLLDRTGEFRNRPEKRYDDTDIIISELIEKLQSDGVLRLQWDDPLLADAEFLLSAGSAESMEPA